MTQTVDNDYVPKIFNEIIRKRVTDYIYGELKILIREKMDSIITDVLSNLQTDTELFRNMLRYETKMVVKAFYNGADVEQHTTKGE